MVDVFVDVDDDDPVGDASTLLPAVIVVIGRRLHERGAGDVKFAEHHLAVGGEQLARPIGRSVVGDEVAIDDGVVVPEEVREHPLLVPAERVEMDGDPGASPPRRQEEAEHATNGPAFRPAEHLTKVRERRLADEARLRSKRTPQVAWCCSTRTGSLWNMSSSLAKVSSMNAANAAGRARTSRR